jgi:hypothetical protein
MAYERSRKAYFMASGIDLKVAATATIGTTAAVRGDFIPTAVMVHCKTATAITVVATISVGQNSATYNDIVAAAALTSLTAAGKAVYLAPIAAAQVVAASTAIKVVVTVAATGTSQTADVWVEGFYTG